jgi:hypothetical protein
MKYVKNSALDDSTFTGVSLTILPDEAPLKGYLAEEISKEDYLVWQERIANPDNKVYFAGIFPGIGVINGATRKALDAKITEATLVRNNKLDHANRLLLILAQRDAKDIGEDPEEVFAAKHPHVGERVKAELFKEHRANPFANGEPRGPK